MTAIRKWAHLTIVDDKGEEFAWVGADIQQGTSNPVHAATVGLTLTEVQARTMARRILETLGEEETP